MFLPSDDGKTPFFDPFGDHNIMDDIIYYIDYNITNCHDA
jgi:hypothetical protein